MNEFVASLNGTKKEIKFVTSDNVRIGGIEYGYEFHSLGGNKYLMRLGERFYEFIAVKLRDDLYQISTGSETCEVTIRTTLQEKAIELLGIKNALHHKTEVKAPMPGMVLKIKKKPGESVSQGESVLILEAMKMENDLHSPSQGLIKSINVKEGTAVEKGAVLFVIE